MLLKAHAKVLYRMYRIINQLLISRLVQSSIHYWNGSSCRWKSEKPANLDLHCFQETLVGTGFWKKKFYALIVLIRSNMMLALHVIKHCPAEPRFIIFWKHCRSRSAGFRRSHLIRIYTDFHSDWKYMLINGMLQVNKINILEECSI